MWRYGMSLVLVCSFAVGAWSAPISVDVTAEQDAAATVLAQRLNIPKAVYLQQTLQQALGRMERLAESAQEDAVREKLRSLSSPERQQEIERITKGR